MILGGFTRICVNIHHPALAASFRDVARLKRTEQGRVTLGVTPQSSHRSGRADCPHPPRHLMKSLPARSVVVTWTWIRSRCTWYVSLLRFLRRRPLPFTGSLGSVPPLRRYYGALRLPATRFATLRFLGWAIPAWRPWFVPIGSGRGAVDHPGVVHPVLPPAVGSGKRQGLPSSRRNPYDHSPYSSDPGVTRQARGGPGMSCLRRPAADHDEGSPRGDIGARSHSV